MRLLDLTTHVRSSLSYYNLVTLLTARQPSLKAMFMSGFSNHHTHATLQKGAVFIQKPFSPEELAEKVKSHLSS
jgi:FixJ family two-component response regulator